MNLPRIAFIGFGEAAQAFVAGWKSEVANLDITAYDILFDDPLRADAKRADCVSLGVRPAASAAAAVSPADIVIAAVTADQVIPAAQSVLPGMKAGQFYLDINSAAPFRKAEAAAPLVGHGIRAVDVAVMAPVHPKRHKTPLLIGGPGAADVAPLLRALGMSLDVVSERIGDASTVKMVRSIAIKGFESVVMECMTAAVAFGVADRVVPTIGDYLAGKDFATLANHVMERVVLHGRRRAAEMREVAATLDHAGLSHFMPAATAKHQDWVADLNLAERFSSAVPHDGAAIAKTLLAALELPRKD